jgi:hypothetical protein
MEEQAHLAGEVGAGFHEGGLLRQHGQAEGEDFGGEDRGNAFGTGQQYGFLHGLLLTGSEASDNPEGVPELRLGTE